MIWGEGDRFMQEHGSTLHILVVYAAYIVLVHVARSPGPKYVADDRILSGHPSTPNSVTFRGPKGRKAPNSTQDGFSVDATDPRFNSDSAERHSWVHGTCTHTGLMVQKRSKAHFPLCSHHPRSRIMLFVLSGTSSGPAQYNPNPSAVRRKQGNTKIGKEKRFNSHVHIDNAHDLEHQTEASPGPKYNPKFNPDKPEAPSFTFSGSATPKYKSKAAPKMSDYENPMDRSSWITGMKRGGLITYTHTYNTQGPGGMSLRERNEIDNKLKPATPKIPFGRTHRFGRRKDSKVGGEEPEEKYDHFAPRVQILSSAHARENMGTQSPGPLAYDMTRRPDLPRTTGGKFAPARPKSGSYRRHQRPKSDWRTVVEGQEDAVSVASTGSQDSRASWLHQGRVSRKAGFSKSMNRDENGPGPAGYTLPSSFASASTTHNKGATRRAQERLDALVSFGYRPHMPSCIHTLPFGSFWCCIERKEAGGAAAQERQKTQGKSESGLKRAWQPFSVLRKGVGASGKSTQARPRIFDMREFERERGGLS
jgi:hypothetical protein